MSNNKGGDDDKRFDRIIHNNLRKGVRNHKKACGIFVLRSVSSLLPYADRIGHKVLRANNDFIDYILALDERYIPHKVKGKIILLSIRLAQWGGWLWWAHAPILS